MLDGREQGVLRWFVHIRGKAGRRVAGEEDNWFECERYNAEGNVRNEMDGQHRGNVTCRAIFEEQEEQLNTMRAKWRVIMNT